MTQSPRVRPLLVVLVGALRTAAAPVEGSGALPEPWAAEVLWDTWGVPHVYSDTELGLCFGFGYAHGRDHGPELLEIAAIAAGRSAEACLAPVASEPYLGCVGGRPGLYGVRKSAITTAALPQHCRSTTPAPPQHYRSTTAALPQHYRSTAAALPQHYRSTAQVLPKYCSSTDPVLPQY